MAHPFRAAVTYNSQTLYSTPFTLSVIPGPIDAANCVVSGSTTVRLPSFSVFLFCFVFDGRSRSLAMRQGGVAGQTLNLSIIGKDAYNNINYNNNPAASFTASLGGQSFVSTFVGNGTYRIPYSFTTAGTYSLSVVSSGTSIRSISHPLCFLHNRRCTLTRLLPRIRPGCSGIALQRDHHSCPPIRCQLRRVGHGHCWRHRWHHALSLRLCVRHVQKSDHLQPAGQLPPLRILG